MRLNGTIVTYAVAKDFGIIRGDDGKNYTFVWSDWLNPLITPEAGQIVSFKPSGSSALQVSVGRG